MKAKTKALLAEAQAYCDENDKSTEFMLQYMQDFAGVDLDCVLNYLQKEGGFTERNKDGVDETRLGLEGEETWTP